MMYDLSKAMDVQSIRARVDALVKRGVRVELTECRSRSRNQNAYLHLLCGWLGLQLGMTTEQVKQDIFKRIVNAEYYVMSVTAPNGATIATIRSTAGASTEEMARQIDRLRDWASSEMGVYLPSADDGESLDYIEFEMKKNLRYL